MVEPSDSEACLLPREGTQGSDPVNRDILALIAHVRASIIMIETAMMRADAKDLDTAGDFHVLDDVSPRYLKLLSVLGAVDASLSAILHDA